jgi:hypothetical protein
MDTPYIHSFLHVLAHLAYLFHNHHIQDTTLLPNIYGYKQREKCNHIPTSQQNTYYINIRQERTPQKYISRSAAHNYYNQIKHKKTLYIHLPF